MSILAKINDMKQLSIITVVIISLWGCSSGNQNTTESSTAAVETETVDTASTSEPQETPQEAVEPAGNPLLDSLKFGMTEEDVVAVLGEPTNKETVGKDPKIFAEDWWYGENQKVRMINHTVNHVVKDVARQKELLQKLMVAKNKKDEAEARRIMDELTAGHK